MVYNSYMNTNQLETRYTQLIELRKIVPLSKEEIDEFTNICFQLLTIELQEDIDVFLHLKDQ